jgi:hypothetical protein
MNWGNGTYGVRLGVNMAPEVKADATTDPATAAVDAETGYNFGFGMPLAGMDFGFGYDDTGTIGLNLRRAQDIWLWENILVGFSMTPEDTDANQVESMGFSADCYSNRSYGDGTNGLFALGFHYGTVGDADATTGTAAADAETGYSFGFGMPLAGMDFGFGYDDSGTIGVNLRRAQDIWLWNNVLVGFGMTPEDTDTNQEEAMSFSADCYANRPYGDGTNGLFALGFHYDVMGDEDATMNLVWNFAVESEMTDWATLRLGYATMYDAGGGSNTAGALQGGLGFNYDSFQLDMNVSVGSLVHDPVVYMTGRNDTQLGSDWTITYSW